MESSNTSSPTSPNPWPTLLRKACRKLERQDDARVSPDAFVELCIRDSNGKPFRQGRVHRELQAFLSEQSHALVELPRDHGKTTQVAARILWELGRNPGLRIRLACATEKVAKDRLRFLRESILRPEVRRIFPNLKPAKPWSEEAFTVERPAEVIGPSVASLGLGSGSTGCRADLLVCDDVVDVTALTSYAARERAGTLFRENLMNLLEPDGRCWNLCTPWHRDDLNAQLKANPAFAVFRRAVGDDCEPVWPERWNAEALKRHRTAIGEPSFARAFCLTALNEKNKLFRHEWLLEYDDDKQKPVRTILAVDPAVSAKARADQTAVVALGLMKDATIRVLDAVGYRAEMPEIVTRLETLVKRFEPERVVFEANGAFQSVSAMLKKQSSFGGRLVNVQHTQNKYLRFGVLAVPVSKGMVLFRGESQAELMEEMLAYPDGKHDDLVDALAMGVEYLSVSEPRLWV